MTDFGAEQAATAEWMGYSDVAAMNRDHDPLHAALCRWLGVSSQSLASGRGEPHDEKLAWIEEDAVLHVQRLIAHLGVAVPA